MSELVLVFEVCKDCRQHDWCTRHVEAHYEERLAQQMSAISAYSIPGLQMLHNEYPVAWRGSQNMPLPQGSAVQGSSAHDQVETITLPRMGAFEISTVYRGVPILFFSKLVSRCWPHSTSVAKRIASFVQDAESMTPDQLRDKYQTSGQIPMQTRQPQVKAVASRSTSTFKSVKSAVKAEASEPATQPAREVPQKMPEEEETKKDLPAETVVEESKPVPEEIPAVTEAPITEAPANETAEVQASDAAQENSHEVPEAEVTEPAQAETAQVETAQAETAQEPVATEDEIVPQNELERKIVVMVNDMFGKHDTDNSGYLERDEARSMVKDILFKMGANEVRDVTTLDQAWQDYDTNHDGKISKREFFEFTKKMF